MTHRHLALAPLLVAMLLLPSACAESTQGLPGLSAPASVSKNMDQRPAATSVPAAPVVAPGGEEEASLEAQIAALSAAEVQLDRAFGPRETRDLAAAKRKDIPPRDEVRTAPGKPGTALDATHGVSADAPSAASVCPMACSALASMSRAVARLCGLAGEGDRRCEDGRTRERTAKQRVQASCPMCGGSAG